MGKKKIINIRVTESEHAKLARMGRSVGGVTALIRENLLTRTPDNARREALVELARLARNLNLIARRARTYDPVRAVEAIAWLTVIDEKLTKGIDQLTKKRSK